MGIFKKMFLDRHTTVMERYNLIKKKEEKKKEGSRHPKLNGYQRPIPWGAVVLWVQPH